jgi:hypothetical protein
MGVSDYIFELSHNGYSKLYDICKSDYSKLTTKPRSISSAMACIIWSFLRGLNYIIIKILSIAYPLSIAASVGAVGFAVWSVYNLLSRTFGIGVFTYLGLFPPVESVFTVLYFIVLVAGTVIVLISLGAQWDEWGKLLQLSTMDYNKYRNIAMQQVSELNSGASDTYSFESGKNQERCQQSINAFSEMISELEDTQQQVYAALSVKNDSTLVYSFTEYTKILEEISHKLSIYESKIPCDTFEKNILPLISRAEVLSKKVKKDAQSILLNTVKSASETKSFSDFFVGCNTEDEVKRRYKALSKIYHPDVGGDHETFTVMQNQYESHMAAYSGT